MKIPKIKSRWRKRSFPNSLFVMTLLMGCTSYPDKNIDPAKNNKAAFERDAIGCAQAYPEVGSGAHVLQRINCMKLKGWR